MVEKMLLPLFLFSLKPFSFPVFIKETKKIKNIKIINYMNNLYDITKQYSRTDLPELKVGDKIEVVTKNFNKNEKDKYRLTHFKGIVIGQKNEKQISYAFSVLKE